MAAGSSCVFLDHQNMATAAKMMAVENPFTFEFKDPDKKIANLTDGINCYISCKSTCWLITYWGVNVNELHSNLRANWNHMRATLMEGSFLEQSCVLKEEPIL